MNISNILSTVDRWVIDNGSPTSGARIVSWNGVPTDNPYAQGTEANMPWLVENGATVMSEDGWAGLKFDGTQYLEGVSGDDFGTQDIEFGFVCSGIKWTAGYTRWLYSTHAHEAGSYIRSAFSSTDYRFVVQLFNTDATSSTYSVVFPEGQRPLDDERFYFNVRMNRDASITFTYISATLTYTTSTSMTGSSTYPIGTNASGASKIGYGGSGLKGNVMAMWVRVGSLSSDEEVIDQARRLGL